MSARLPADFDPKVYLELNPDVALAGVDPHEHFVAYGIREQRQYRHQAASRIQHLKKPPSEQAVLDIFLGEWSCALPKHLRLRTEPGHAAVFENDARIQFLAEELGPVKGAHVLEIGPLEGGHTYLLHQLGAASITAVESNERAFLKCLCVKEILGLERARFLFGDAVAYMEQPGRRYDIVVASGILYHMADPLSLLEALAARAERLLIWTHYYDAAILRSRSDWHLFDEPRLLSEATGVQGAKRRYPQEALNWSGFSGGSEAFAIWLTRDSILGFLRERGFGRLVVGVESPDHPNGPAFTVAASR